MDKEKTTVTMSLQDFDELRSYKKAYDQLQRNIKSLTYIDQMTSDEITVVINKDKAQDFIVPFAAIDCELDGYPEGVKVIYK